MSIAVKTVDGPSTNGFEDTFLLNNSVPGLDLEEIDLSLTFLRKKVSYPIIINAITGGTDRAININRCLATMAAKYDLPMAVGSGNVAILQPEARSSFEIVRQINPDGLIFANIGANESADKALKVIEIIAADALQLHFNVPQELAMREGDRHFKHVLANVKKIVDLSSVPVIAKEVGFGFSREAVEKLFNCGVKIFDNGGKGGTNFIVIEKHREGNFNNEFDDWGIPTAWSLAEIVALNLPVTLIASGGIRTAIDAVKAIAMGADLAGIAGPLLKNILNEGPESADKYLNDFLFNLKAAFLMTGAKNIEELSLKPLIIMNQTAEWLKARGISTETWSGR